MTAEAELALVRAGMSAERAGELIRTSSASVFAGLPLSPWAAALCLPKPSPACSYCRASLGDGNRCGNCGAPVIREGER